MEGQKKYRSIIERSPASMITSMAYRGQEEKKFLDVGDGDTTFVVPPVANMSFQLLNAPLVGAAFYNRIGNKITMKSVHIKVGLGPRVPDVAPGGNNETCRVMLVYDRQSNGSDPTPSTLLADYAAGGATQTTVFSGMNPNQTGRFVILREHFFKIFNVNNVAGLTSSASSFYQQDGHWFVNWYVKLKDLETIYQASTGEIGDITNGALFLVLMSNVSALAPTSGACLFQYKSRLRFIG